MAEQKGEEEKKKVIELQKQIAEERQINELRQLQVASGHVIKVVDNTLDWMYEGPAAEKVQQQVAEEHLLGKTYKAKEENSNDLKKVGKKLTHNVHLCSSPPPPKRGGQTNYIPRITKWRPYEQQYIYSTDIDRCFSNCTNCSVRKRECRNRESAF